MLLFNKITKKLIKKKITISVAESCTGGLLCANITAVSGVSEIFNMGLITYSNKAKSNLINIKSNHIKKYGAVSYETAKLMAENLHKISRSALCISTTGIAGPTGGSIKKPVGLIYIGIKYKNEVNVLEKNFSGSREQIQKKTIKTIFKLIDELI